MTARVLYVCSVLLLSSIAASGAARAQDAAAVGRAWTTLESGLGADKPPTRGKAVQALGLLERDDRARRMAEAKLTDGDEDVRAAAATALGQIGLPAAVPALKRAAAEQEAAVVFAAAGALHALGDPLAYNIYYAVLTGRRKTGEGLVESQLDMLKDPNALARIGFEAGLGFVPFGGISYKIVKGFTQDKTSPVRAAAAARLIRDPDPKTAQALAEATRDDKWLVRAAVADAIAKRGDRALAPAVVALLDDEEETVRFTAAAAVVRLASAR